MSKPSINDQVAQHCVSNYMCCRCGHEKDKKATLIRYGAPFCSDECAERASDYTLDDGQQMLKNYDQSLDAMREAEETLDFIQQRRFAKHMRRVVIRDWNKRPEIVGGSELDYDSPSWLTEWLISHASAPQHAEAFLTTVNETEKEQLKC